MYKFEKVLNHVGLGVVARTASKATQHSPFVFDEDLHAWVRHDESGEGVRTDTDQADLITDNQSDLWLTW